MAEQDDDSFVTTDDDGGYAPVDFGGGDDNDDDEDDDEDHKERFPVAFIHDGDHRFSSDSFQTTYEASQPPSQATVLLDAIAAGEIPGSQSNYEFFNKKALEAIQGNQWAGAAHWKKIQPKRDLTTSEPEKADASKVLRKRKGKATKTRNTGKITVEISQISSSIINEALQKPSKGRKGNDSLQMTKAAIAKASKNENILPFDAGIKVEDFTSLFLRPKTNVRDFSSSAHLRVPPRQVGFGGVETWGNHDDNSFGADAADEGTGFDFGGDYDDDPGDFVIPELEGVRKVEKVKVGYATVAKKVDVKRLKHDLWEELERTFQQRGQLQAEVFNDDTLDEKMEALDDSENAEQLSETFGIRQTPLSFQDTVREMQATQSQPDVTLPFYFICILHLANEKGLALETMGLGDFIIHSS